MTRRTIQDRPKAVLFDAGGVLVTPHFELHREVVDERLTIEEIRRHFYAAYTASAMPTEGAMPSFWVDFATRIGLGGDAFRGLDPQRGHTMVRWSRPVPGAAALLAEIKALGIGVAVVSNAAGDVDRLLDEAGVCHVGADGSGVAIDAIFDSGDPARYPDERASRKPAPTMLVDAGRHFDAAPHEMLFVGDALWSDGLAAQQAGVPFLHMDPFGDCRAVPFVDAGLHLRPTDHDHVAAMDDVLAYALGEHARTTVLASRSRTMGD